MCSCVRVFVYNVHAFDVHVRCVSWLYGCVLFDWTRSRVLVVDCTVKNIPSTVYCVYYTSYNELYRIYKVHDIRHTIYIIRYTTYNIRHTIYFVQSTSYNLLRTIYDIQSTSYSIRLTMSTVHSSHAYKYDRMLIDVRTSY